MIGSGVLLIFIGGILWFCGVEMNDDIERQMESWLNSGRTDPGDGFVAIGVFLVIVGAILLIAGIVRDASQSQKAAPSQPKTPTNIPMNDVKSQLKKHCAYCGADIADESLYCSACGHENSNFIKCPCCNRRLPSTAVFCDLCGTGVHLAKYGLVNASLDDVLKCAFNLLEHGRFKDAKILFDNAAKRDAGNLRVHLGQLLATYDASSVDAMADVKCDFTLDPHFLIIMSSNDEELKYQLNMCRRHAKACNLIRNREFVRAAQQFEQLGHWRDSHIKLDYCRREQIKKEQEEKAAAKEKRKDVIIVSLFMAVLAGLIFLGIALAA